MQNHIDDTMMDHISALAQLTLDEESMKQAKQDMNRMLSYMDQLGALDTEGVSPLTHLLPVHNVFREDVVTNGDFAARTMQNAPQQKDGMFVVPRTF